MGDDERCDQTIGAAEIRAGERRQVEIVDGAVAVGAVVQAGVEPAPRHSRNEKSLPVY
jgi:hypothetical protein